MLAEIFEENHADLLPVEMYFLGCFYISQCTFIYVFTSLDINDMYWNSKDG